MTTDIITRPIAAELKRYEELFDSCLSHKDGVLDLALRHLAQRRGKMMRPKLMLLFAKAHGEVGEAVLHAAVAIEMLHTASLVHDDIVDESDRRRGQKSVNALLDNKAAVLVGDYLLSTALSQAAMTGDPRVTGRLAWLGQTLAEGELMQLDCTHESEVSEEAYTEVIRRKTASLFAVCAELGTMLAPHPTPAPAAFAIGEAIGMAFQVRDDMFDYYPAEVGKPVCGADLREGKLTLPVIHAVQVCPELLPLARKARALEATDDELSLLINAAREHGMDYAREVMNGWADKACRSFPTADAEVLAALREYVRVVVEREK